MDLLPIMCFLRFDSLQGKVLETNETLLKEEEEETRTMERRAAKVCRQSKPLKKIEEVIELRALPKPLKWLGNSNHVGSEARVREKEQHEKIPVLARCPAKATLTHRRLVFKCLKLEVTGDKTISGNCRNGCWFLQKQLLLLRNVFSWQFVFPYHYTTFIWISFTHIKEIMGNPD